MDPVRSCCRVAERAGLGSAATGRARSAGVARLAVRLEAAASGSWGATRAWADSEAPTFGWEGARDHCRMAWLRGLFLTRGSLSMGEGRTHLEFVVGAGEAPVLAARTAQAGLLASWRVRRGRGVVTCKDRELVLGFLRRAGATGAALELEARGVAASLHGYLNRVINAEGANLSRSVYSSTRQLAAIRVLEKTGGLERLPDFSRTVARVRREAPEATVSDLARRTGASRARVQRALHRLEVLGSGSSARGMG